MSSSSSSVSTTLPLPFKPATLTCCLLCCLPETISMPVLHRWVDNLRIRVRRVVRLLDRQRSLNIINFSMEPLHEDIFADLMHPDCTSHETFTDPVDLVLLIVQAERAYLQEVLNVNYFITQEMNNATEKKLGHVLALLEDPIPDPEHRHDDHFFVPNISIIETCKTAIDAALNDVKRLEFFLDSMHPLTA